jgi:hypothetical protein
VKARYSLFGGQFATLSCEINHFIERRESNGHLSSFHDEPSERLGDSGLEE